MHQKSLQHFPRPIAVFMRKEEVKGEGKRIRKGEEEKGAREDEGKEAIYGGSRRGRETRTTVISCHFVDIYIDFC